MTFDVVVLGGGPAGLAAAWYGARAGRDVALVERAPQVGGLAGSFGVAGVRVDHGSHRLHGRTDPALLADLAGLLDGELQHRRRHGRIRLDGRWLAFPLRLGDLLRRAPPSFALGAARDAVLGPWRRSDGGDSFAACVRRGLGPTIAEAFYEPYAHKLFGVPASELSAELYRRRVGARSTGGVLRRMLTPAPRSGFWYPAGGFGRIAESVGKAAERSGARIETGVAATSVEPGEGGAAVTLADGRRLETRRVFSTLPASVTTSLYGNGEVGAETREAAGALSYRSVLLVYLVVPRRPYTEFDAHYFPERHHPVARLSEPTNYRTSSADPTDRTVLCAELPGAPEDDWWVLDGDSLGTLVGDVLIAEGLPDPTPVEVVVRRVHHVYPVYRAGHDAHQEVLERWASRRPELVLFGRQPLFAHDNTHHAMAMGRAAASCLGPGGSFDGARWSTLREEFRHHVVED